MKKDSSFVSGLRDSFNEAERTLRAHPNFDEVYEEDMVTIHNFRETAGIGPYEDGIDDESTLFASQADTSTVASMSSRPRKRRSYSTSGSVSTFRSKTSMQSNLTPMKEVHASLGAEEEQEESEHEQESEKEGENSDEDVADEADGASETGSVAGTASRSSVARNLTSSPGSESSRSSMS
jgi:hypothetical protein